MCNPIKAVGKAFKTVGKVVKKVAPIVLAAGAIYFTAGAALGVAGAAGGWGAAVSGAVSQLGAGSVLSGVLTGAITQAGYGAAIGGLVSGVTGGNILKGMKAGALTGAVTGGVMGGLGMATDPLAGIGEQTTQGVPTTTTAQAGAESASQAATAGADAASQAATAGADAASKAAGGLMPKSGGGLFSQGGWLERNQTLAGQIVAGLGQGLSASAQADAEKDLVRERYEQVRQNYAGADPSAGFRQLAPGQSGQTPTQRFDPRTYGTWEYAYNPRSGRIERVPVQTA